MKKAEQHKMTIKAKSEQLVRVKLPKPNKTATVRGGFSLSFKNLFKFK